MNEYSESFVNNLKKTTLIVLGIATYWIVHTYGIAIVVEGHCVVGLYLLLVSCWSWNQKNTNNRQKFKSNTFQYHINRRNQSIHYIIYMWLN